MNPVKSLANEHPLAFSFLVTIVLVLLLVVSAALAVVWPSEETYGQPGGILGRSVSTIALLMTLAGLGWLRPAGFTRIGRWHTWGIPLLLLASVVALLTFTVTGEVGFLSLQTQLSSLTLLFILAAVFLEEVVFRGLILTAFVRRWGSTKRDLIKSVLLSSLFFAGIHLLDVFSGRPLANVIVQSVQAFFLGITLAALVLWGKSIYPAVFFHLGFNIAGYLVLNAAASEPALTTWMLLAALMVPPAVLAFFLLRPVPRCSSGSERASI